MYKLHICFGKNEMLHVANLTWKYIDMVNYSKFLWDLEEMKNCKYRVETANAGMTL